MKTRISILTTALAILVLLFGNYVQPVMADTKSTDDAPILLRGTIVTPDNVIKHGYVLVEDGRIMDVSDKRPDVAGAIELNTDGIIYPGLVDVHNHTTWNVIPRWNPPHLYSNQSEWNTGSDFIQKVAAPHDNLLNHGSFCDMNAYGEMRALVGGETSTIGTYAEPCIHGLVRNLEYDSGFYGPTQLNLEHILYIIHAPPASDPLARQQFVAIAKYYMANPAYEALILHVAEGVDPAALEEFTFLQANGLLNPKGVIIHGIALGPSQFQAMASAGTSLVWSPRSNINLYGQTADINAALDVGVQVALAPDWGVTGSSNILDELHFADQWNREHLGGRLTDKQLVDMVTSVPAKMVGINDEVGAIQPGLRADLLVISGDHNNPYRALIEATPTDVQLVMIGGVPVYGEAHAMGSFWKSSDLQQIQVGDTSKVLATYAANFTFADVVTRLEAALEAQGTTLAPLIEDSGAK